MTFRLKNIPHLYKNELETKNGGFSQLGHNLSELDILNRYSTK